MEAQRQCERLFSYSIYIDHGLAINVTAQLALGRKDFGFPLVVIGALPAVASCLLIERLALRLTDKARWHLSAERAGGVPQDLATARTS